MLFTKQYHKTHTASWEFLHPAPKPECDGLMRSKKVGFETVQLGERGTVRCLNNFSAVSNGAAKNHAEDHANYLFKQWGNVQKLYMVNRLQCSQKAFEHNPHLM